MKTLLLDIETAPHRVYAWGLWDQNIALNQIEEPGYTICWAAKWYGEKSIDFASIHKDGRVAMLEIIWTLLDDADCVVHYNGTRFDIPTLNQEFVKEGLPPPAPYKQVDLLLTARRRFRLPSNKLSYVSEYLGYGDKVKHKGMDLWRECMQGDDKAWKTMEEYNKRDVELLEKVYGRLLPWVNNHPNVALYDGDVEHSCPRCGSHNVQRRGLAHTATLTYQRYHCNDCGSWSRERVNNMPKEKKANLLVEAR